MGIAEEIPTYNISGVEVFSTGIWNKDPYTISDLHDMVDAFESLKGGFRPFLKLGHDENQSFANESGFPAIGWVDRVYVSGQKLMADFTHIPKAIFDLIKTKAYRKVSCEIYWDLDANGQKFNRVLSAVALLGAENPAVMNLADILGQYNLEFQARVFNKDKEKTIIKMYETEFDIKTGDNNMPEQKQESKTEDLSKELEAAKKDYTALEISKTDLEKQIEQKDEQLKKFQLQAEEAQKNEAKAKIEKFCNELVSKELSTPAMGEHVTQLLSDKKEYSIGEDKKTKEELITDLLHLSKEATKVNFAESSKAGEQDNMQEDEDIVREMNRLMAEEELPAKEALKKAKAAKKK